MEQVSDLDDVRYEHHVKHRGEVNHWIFWGVWFFATAVVFARAGRRAVGWWKRRMHRKHRYVRLEESHGGTRYFDRGLKILDAVLGIPFPKVFGWKVTSLPLGKFVLVAIYGMVVVVLLTSVDAPAFSSHYLDDTAFRAAWVTLTQVPLVYLLSTKRGPINLLAGLSYERINWLHRWIGRTLFLSATVHMAIMKSSISMQDILYSGDEGMTVVRYGIAAYTTLAWIALTSVLPLRHWSYRIFYLNHWISTFSFLFIAFQHVPTYARMPIYLSISIMALDKILVAYYFCCNNITIRRPSRKFSRLRRGSGREALLMGYPIKMTTPSLAVSSLPTQPRSEATIVRISNIPFSWRPGQHMRLHVPALGRFEMHPFTPANCSTMPPPPLPPRKDIERGTGRVISHPMPEQISEMVLMIKEKSGFTQRLAQYQREWLERPCPNASTQCETLTAYIDGPYGNVPTWEKYENLVLIASSTGVSFTLSILDHLEQLCFTGSAHLKTRAIKFIWTTRHLDPHFDTTVKDLLTRYTTMLFDQDISLHTEFYITCPDSKPQPSPSLQYDPFAHLRHTPHKPLTSRPPLRIRHPSEIYQEWDREAQEMLGTDDVSPFIVDSALYEEYEDNSDETCTLVDDDESPISQHGQRDDPFSDAHATVLNDDAYRPLPPRRQSSARSLEGEKADEEGCKCALIQYQRDKLLPQRGRSSSANEDIMYNYAIRPDVASLVRDAGVSGRAMVAVCANERVGREVRVGAASAGVKGRGVEVWVEGGGGS